ncbi:MAG: PAS domain-containing protein [Planctomycetes bacterium]|nr:PAS domain-containing protein [Planctomycetota bacterium]
MLCQGLEVLDTQVAVLDRDGTIRAVNAAWREFAAAHGGDGKDLQEGGKYLDACARGAARCPDPAAATRAIRSVLAGAGAATPVEYASARTGEERWYRLTVVGITHEGERLAIVARADVTAAVTARRSAAAATARAESLHADLAAHRERLALALAGGDLGLWDWNVQTGDVFYDDRWCRMLGHGADELRPHVDSWASRVHPDDLPLAQRRLQEHFARATGLYECEHRLRAKDGSWRWVLARGKVMTWDADGKPSRMVGTHLDTTARRQAEEALRRSRQLLEEMGQVARVGGWEFDPRSAVNTWTKAIHEIYELPHDCVPTPELGLGGYPEPGRSTLARAFTEAVEAAQPFDLELPFVSARGTPRWVRAIGKAERQDGRTTRVYGAFQDVTDRVERERRVRESEALFKAVADTVPVLLWMSDAQKQSTFFNRAWLEFTGHSLADELAGAWIGAVHPEDREAMLRHCQECFTQRRPLEMEFRMRRHDGEYRWMLDRGVPRHDSEGRFVGFVGASVDVHEQRLLRDQLREATARAERASRAKSEFLANISHEIRTPLTAILGCADLLEGHDGGIDAGVDRADLVETIRRSGQHLLALLNDVLDLSKIEARSMQIEAIPFAPAHLVAEVVEMLRQRALAKGLMLELHVQGSLPARVLSDPTRLRQVLVNLVGNAIKFTASGRVVLRTSAEEAEDGRVCLRFEIEDSGVGMTEEQTRHLFQAFSQADATTTRRFGGTGLGLAISRRIARLLGGDVELVRTAKDAGSTFRFTCTVAREVAPPPARTTPGNSPAPVPAPPSLAGRILLAEDGLDSQRLIAALLRRAGARVEVAANGRVALERVRAAEQSRAPFDLVLLDMQMPEVDGYTAARQLRAEGWPGAIVALTAHAMQEDQERCIAAGCDAYAAKPIERDQLYQICAHWLGRKRS